jgi:hypothetical protein
MPWMLPAAPAKSHLKVVSHDNSNFRSLSGRIGQSSPRNTVAGAHVSVCLIAVPLGNFHRSRKCYRIYGQQIIVVFERFPGGEQVELRVQFIQAHPSLPTPKPCAFLRFRCNHTPTGAMFPAQIIRHTPSCIFPNRQSASRIRISPKQTSARASTAIVRFPSIQLPIPAS